MILQEKAEERLNFEWTDGPGLKPRPYGGRPFRAAVLELRYVPPFPWTGIPGAPSTSCCSAYMQAAALSMWRTNSIAPWEDGLHPRRSAGAPADTRARRPGGSSPRRAWSSSRAASDDRASPRTGSADRRADRDAPCRAARARPGRSASSRHSAGRPGCPTARRSASRRAPSAAVAPLGDAARVDDLPLHVEAVDQEGVAAVFQELEQRARVLPHQDGVRRIVVDGTDRRRRADADRAARSRRPACRRCCCASCRRSSSPASGTARRGRSARAPSPS